MRKIFITSFLILLSVALISGSAYALSGVCSNCHTMHYSQNGAAVGVGGPYNYLLLADCVGCHTGPPGVAVNDHYAPIVLRTGDPGGQGRQKTLAGGDFYWVKQGNDALGHNVADLGVGQDSLIKSYVPPGWDRAATAGGAFGQINGGSNMWLDINQLKCAGFVGCHGNHKDNSPAPNNSEAGILGSHHSNTGLTATQAVDAPTVGGSYRFLGGINGLENSEWNWNETADIHNEYYGVDSPTNRDQASTTYADKHTISYLCAECHGFFHSRIDDTTAGSSPWRRHPTDVVLPNTAEYSAYNPDGLPSGSGAIAGNTDYSIEAPVARPTVPATSSKDVTPGSDAIVMCLSCHRAHGSPEPDLLRWAYSGIQAGSGTTDNGCFNCHTTKNAD